jgi:hypothetical protein
MQLKVVTKEVTINAKQPRGVNPWAEFQLSDFSGLLV